MPDYPFKAKDLTTSNSLVDARLKNAHRERNYAFQFSGMLHGAFVINDSAATTLEKSGESIMAIEKEVVWILDSSAYLQDFRILSELIRNKVKTIIGTGDYADEVHRAVWTDLNCFVSAHSWEEALDMASIVSKPGDSILFSPGCCAGEPFENYAERGDFFDKLVQLRNQ